MELRGRVALVTGAGRRVGRVIALALAAEGMRVAVHFHRSAEGADETARLANERGGEGRTFSADLSRADAPARLVDEVARALGSLDVLINSAAGMERTPFGEIDAERWDRIFALNLRGPFLLAQAVAPVMRTGTGGAIINIADLAAFESWPGYLPHGISKAGVVHMTRGLARVLAPAIRVNAVAPGTVLLPDDWDEGAADHLVETTPLGRLGEPEDVAGAVLYLLRADYVTGETIVVDGGRRVRG